MAERILVCGGRDFNDRRAVLEVLDSIPATTGLPITCIIQGGANGADAHARGFAYITGIECQTYGANWRLNGRAAGPIRNQRMLDEGKPDLVIAFPGGRGTADMVRRAKAAGIPVREVSPDQRMGGVDG